MEVTCQENPFGIIIAMNVNARTINQQREQVLDDIYSRIQGVSRLKIEKKKSTMLIVAIVTIVAIVAIS